MPNLTPFENGLITEKPVYWRTFKEENPGKDVLQVAIDWAIAKSKMKPDIQKISKDFDKAAKENEKLTSQLIKSIF